MSSDRAPSRFRLRGRTVLIWLLGGLGCASPHHTKYPSWEPTSPVVPEVLDREVARRYLQESWKAFQKYGDRPRQSAKSAPVHYTYVRAYELSDDEVHFTVLVVNAGRVETQALLVADPRKLNFLADTRDGLPPEVRWEESAAAIGQHSDGAPPLTIEALYDLCRDEVLGKHPELVPRMYFHPDGLLQHCGFLADECRNCPSASIQTFGTYYPTDRQHPLDYLCTRKFGMFVADSFYYGSCHCMAIWRPPSHPPPPRPGAAEFCSIDPSVCRGGPGEICRIDPSACPHEHALPSASWSCNMLPQPIVRDEGVRPTDLGKPDPSGPWDYADRLKREEHNGRY